MTIFTQYRDPTEFTICQFHMKVIDTKLHVYLREKIMMTWQLKQLLAVMKIIDTSCLVCSRTTFSDCKHKSFYYSFFLTFHVLT